MGFQWLAMRIQEEQERRERESWIRERLPRALAELSEYMKACVVAYREAFGPESAEIVVSGDSVRATVLDEQAGVWRPRAEVAVETLGSLPGFRVVSGGNAIEIQVGVLPGDRVFYKHGEQYLTMEQLTRLILDRALFPQLGE